jgi:vacuolar-type H+-ATPase subunit I/STV1
MLQKDLLLEDGWLTEWRYKNLVTVGCRLKDFEWTENFIHEFKPKLNKNVRENAFNYNLAYFYYAVDKMDEALEILNNVKFTDMVYILDSRGLILRIYFDQDEEDPMAYQIESFQSYLKRNKSVSESVRKRYTNLLRYLRKLSRIRSNLKFKRDKDLLDDLNDLKTNIDANRQEIANPIWFKTKIEELQTKYGS